MLFWFGFSVGGLFVLLFATTVIWFKKFDNKSNDRFFTLQRMQYECFLERVVEERRLANALETMVEKFTFYQQPQPSITVDEHKRLFSGQCSHGKALGQP